MGQSVERWVAALGLAGGLLLVFLTPPFQVADEPAHFRRIYQVAAGAREAPGADGRRVVELPASFEQIITLTVGDVPFHPERRLRAGVVAAAWRVPLAPERTQAVAVGLLSPYAPPPYLGALAAVAVGRWCRAGPLALLYLARLGNLALALAVCWAAVRLAPCGRWALALVALTPMAMFERSSASADALTDALALLVVSLVLRLALGGGGAAAGAEAAAAEAEPRVPWLMALLLGAACLLAAVKAAYFLLDLLLFLVPAARLGSRRRVLVLRGGGVAAIAIGIGVSRWVASEYFGSGLLREGVRPFAQLAGVLAAPFHFVGLAVGDYLLRAPRYGAACMGVLGWADTPLPRLALVVWALLLVAACLTGGEPGVAVGRWARLFGAAVAAATLLLLSLSQYLAWTPLGTDRIEGLQGRYFLPLLPLGVLLLYNRRLAGRWPAGRGAGRRLGGLSVAFVVLTLGTVWLRYYGPAGGPPARQAAGLTAPPAAAKTSVNQGPQGRPGEVSQTR